MSSSLMIYRGTTVRRRLTIKNSDGSPHDLTGATVYFTVKSEAWDDDSNDNHAVIAKTFTGFETPTAGIVNIDLTAQETYKPAESYYYDIRVAKGESVYKVKFGKFIIQGTPTNSPSSGGSDG